MTTAMTTMKELQDKYMTLMTRVEEPVVKYAGKAAESVAEYVPEMPSWSFLDQVPTITEVVEAQLKFRKRVVDEQAAFVRKMMKAMHPLTRVEPHAPVAKRPVAKRPAVRRVGVKAA